MLTEHGVQLAPRTYRSWKSSMPSARTVSDAHLTDALRATVGTPEGMYGRRKMTAYLRRQGHRVAGCTVDRLMRDEGLFGVIRAVRTAPPSQPRASVAGRRICSIATSPRPRRTASGSPTSPTPAPGWVRLCGVRHQLLLTGDRGLACHHR